MSHDELPTSHVNTADLAPIDAIGYALGVALPATVETIVTRVERLLASEKGFQRASEKIGDLEKVCEERGKTIADLHQFFDRTSGDVVKLTAERDRLLAELAQERLLFRRLVNALRSGE